MAAMEKPHDLDDKTEPISKTQSVAPGEIVALDAGEVFLREHNFTDAYLQELLDDKQMNKKLVRKIDLLILPLLAGTYALQYIDKQALSYAAVFDLFTDTGVSQEQYGWFASIFYLAYLVAEYPWSWLVQKTRMAKVVSLCIMTWGSVLMVTAACRDFAGLAACRFFLGIFEAPVTTCFVMIVGMWYTRQEQPFRAGIFYCCNGVGSMVGGLLTFGIGQIRSLPVWKAVFLVCGGMTVLWGGLVLVLLPDSILTAKRFSLEEKALLIGRGRLGRTGILNQSVKLHQIREALLDPQVWLLTLFMLLNETINGGIANFGKLIIKGVVTDPFLTVALGIPQGAFQVFWILLGTWAASRFRNIRTIVMAAFLIPTIVGTCLMWKLDRKQHKIGVLFGYYICGSYVTSLVLALQMPATNLGGYTKRLAGTATVFMAYCVGNVIGPHAFLGQESPTYPTGCKLILACATAQFVTAISLRMMLVWRNKKRDQQNSGEAEADVDTGADSTDFENPRFRYVL